MQEILWGGGKVRTAVLMGLGFGGYMGLFYFVEFGSIASAIPGGLLFAAIFGPFGAHSQWKSWTGARELSSKDRMAVIRSVRRGQDISNARLAQAVLDYADAIRRTENRAHNSQWVLWIFLGLGVIVGITNVLNGPVRMTIATWSTVILLAGVLVWQPWNRARVLANASHAESAARELLQQLPTEVPAGS